jgi:hypothetical protein
LELFFCEDANQACLNERMKHKKSKRNPWVAFKSFALAQCGRDDGGVKRSRQSLT